MLPFMSLSVAPRIAQPPLSIHAEEGSVANFDCKYLGIRYPVTEVSWIREDAAKDAPPLVCFCLICM